MYCGLGWGTPTSRTYQYPSITTAQHVDVKEGVGSKVEGTDRELNENFIELDCGVARWGLARSAVTKKSYVSSELQSVWALLFHLWKGFVRGALRWLSCFELGKDSEREDWTRSIEFAEFDK